MGVVSDYSYTSELTWARQGRTVTAENSLGAKRKADCERGSADESLHAEEGATALSCRYDIAISDGATSR